MSVFKLRPVFKEYIWGGTRLIEEYGKECGFEKLAESWELACRSDGMNTSEDGDLKDRTLGEIIRLSSGQILGSRCRGMEFPILIKLIDATDDLSVQVHPDDEYSLSHEGEPGKTEMWYVIDCKQDSQIIYGLKNEITKADLIQALNDNRLSELVNRVRVKKGDVFYIPSGTLHAIGKGIVIAEIQQNSNITYRVFDYNRLGKDGKPRELHIQKAVDVINTRPTEVTKHFPAVKCKGFEYTLLVKCRYFTTVRFDVEDKVVLDIDGQSFAHILMLSGEGMISGLEAKKGNSFFIAASSGRTEIKGHCSFILTRTGCEEGIDKLVEKPR